MIRLLLDALQSEDCSYGGPPCDVLTPSGPVLLGGRTVEVAIWAKAAVSQAQLDAFAGFLNNYAKMEPAFATAIKARYTDDEGDLIEWLEEVLEPVYWATLFPGCKNAAEVTADQYFKALTLCSVRFYPDPAPDDEEIVADYRFCVPESMLLPEHSNYQQHLDRCDVTDQVLAVKAMLDGRLLGVDHES